MSSMWQERELPFPRSKDSLSGTKMPQEVMSGRPHFCNWCLYSSVTNLALQKNIALFVCTQVWEKEWEWKRETKTQGGVGDRERAQRDPVCTNLPCHTKTGTGIQYAHSMQNENIQKRSDSVSTWLQATERATSEQLFPQICWHYSTSIQAISVFLNRQALCPSGIICTHAAHSESLHRGKNG